MPVSGRFNYVWPAVVCQVDDCECVCTGAPNKSAS